MRAVLAVVAVLPLLAACSGFYASDQPDWIVNRIPLESCGTEDLGPGGNDVNVDARTCLLEAFQSGEGAELITSATTEEGDPITTFARVHENGTVEIFVDATQDTFGSQRWERYRCDRLVPADVSTDPPSDERVFIAQDCEELPIP